MGRDAPALLDCTLKLLGGVGYESRGPLVFTELTIGPCRARGGVQQDEFVVRRCLEGAVHGLQLLTPLTQFDPRRLNYAGILTGNSRIP